MIMIEKNKKYTFRKQKGNKGAGYLEYLLSDFSIVHRIDESKDVGLDFICELVEKEDPTRLLFAVQCKTHKKKPNVGRWSKTFGYWREFDIPIYLFWVKLQKRKKIVKYKRFTPILHNFRKHKNEDYIVFSKKKFIDDFYYDYFRCNYRKGSFPYSSKYIFKNLINEYDIEIKRQGWAMPYATGLIFHRKGDNEALKKAKTCFEFSKKFMKRNNPWKSDLEIKLNNINNRLRNEKSN